ncbi:lysophospholipase-like protein 1 isoform X2 [Aquila chrysaetos chrysaetos]|nr:lysophospholipase-like protein 1 isoform X2 [Aquila chrysaetos chrysaetos]
MAFQHIKVIYPTAPARICVQNVRQMFPWPGEVFAALSLLESPVLSHALYLFHVHGTGQKKICILSLLTCVTRPYTPMKGAFSTVWFDRYKISNDCPEHIESIDSMCQRLTDLINDEIKNGIAKNRILIGGFSMGGGMAMHLAYRFHQDLAGVFALSSFLNKDSSVYQALKRNQSVLPELFQCHGTADELVLYSWGEETNKMLKSLGVSASLHTFPNLNHELSRTEIEKLKTWIVKKLPVEAAKTNE